MRNPLTIKSSISNRNAKKPPQKRRRLSTTSSTTSTATTSTLLSPLTNFSDVSLWNTTRSTTPQGHLSCTSCRRAITANSEAKPGNLVVCPRCHATSCIICSRVCSAAPPSLPPTPLLSYSPTPPATPLVLASPTRHVSQLLGDVPTPRATRTTRAGTRRKEREGEDNFECDENESGFLDVESGEGLSEKGKYVSGCGRTLCRDCCIENTQ
ncbi:hypothetical protein BD410DRAFT_787173, partial [Rickenella mellea]